MKLFGTLLVALVIATVGHNPASAVEIFETSGELTASDPTQLGRLSRNGVPQDWTGGESYPGVLNPTTSYHYQTFDIPITNAPYVQISFDSISANTFVSAYLDSYALANWLGDAGRSGNFFGVDPLFFQVIVPVGHDLILVVNQTSTGGAGLGDPFSILVEGFVDTEYTDPVTAAVPEPSTWAMMMLGFAGVGFMTYRRRKTAARAA